MEGENYKNFDAVVSKMRTFFKDVKGYVSLVKRTIIIK
jgi:hypothetical protein